MRAGRVRRFFRALARPCSTRNGFEHHSYRSFLQGFISPPRSRLQPWISHDCLNDLKNNPPNSNLAAFSYMGKLI